MTSRRKSTRREFLRGHAAADALADATQGAMSPTADDLPARDRGSYLVHFTRTAMACQFQVYLNAGQYADGAAAALAALDLVDELEDQMTVYREESELSEINRRAADEMVTVEPRLFGLLRQSIDLYHETGGALDITSAPLSKVWGFFRRAGTLPGDGDLRAALRRVGSRLVQLDDAGQTVHFARPGVELNLASIGKGYALDRCAELLTQAGVGDFLLHGGQSSILARGSAGVLSDQPEETSGGQDGPPAGWTVGVRHPLWQQHRLAEVRLVDQALATSGSAVQFFHHQGRRYGHILDPRTGYPVEGMLSTTVVAPTAAEADALATAMYVMRPDNAVEYCRRHPHVAALVISPGGRRGEIDVRAEGFTEGQITLLGE